MRPEVLPSGARPNGCYHRAPLKETVIVQAGWSEIFRDGHGNPHRSPVLVELPDPMTKDCQYSIRYGDEARCAGCRWNQYPQPEGETGMTATSMEHGPAVLLELDPTHMDTKSNEAIPHHSTSDHSMSDQTNP